MQSLTLLVNKNKDSSYIIDGDLKPGPIRFENHRLVFRFKHE